METALTAGLGPWILAALALACLVAAAAALRAYRDSRFSPIYMLRRQASERLRNRSLLAFSLLVVSCGLGGALSQRPPLVLPGLPALRIPGLGDPFDPTPTRTSPTATRPRPSEAAPLASTATPTLVAPPTRAAPPEPLGSATAGLPQALLTPVTPRATPQAGAHFGEIVMASRISAGSIPVVVTDTYRTGRFTIYAVFTYTQMSSGVAWTQYWWRDSTPVRGETALWRLQTQGRGYVYVNPAEGWLPGEYLVQLYIGEQLERTARFKVLP